MYWLWILDLLIEYNPHQAEQNNNITQSKNKTQLKSYIPNKFWQRKSYFEMFPLELGRDDSSTNDGKCKVI